MSRKIPLPEGEWAMLRAPKQIPERLRRPILQQIPEIAAADPQNLDAAAVMGMFDLRDVMIMAFVDQWSFPSEINIESIQDLPGETYDALLEEIEPEIGQMVNPAKPGEPGSPPNASPSSATG